MENYQHALLLLETITPLHIGCGQDVGIVDLPVIRERTTGYPFVPGSSFRGSLRSVFEDKSNSDTDILFGPDNEKMTEDNAYAGCLAIHDARILLYPVRSDKMIFCWITCPSVLSRFDRDLSVFINDSSLASSLAVTLGDDTFIGSDLLGDKIYLEEFLFTRDLDEPNLTKLVSWAKTINGKINLPDLPNRICLVNDQTFFHFVNYGTMVVQHNALTTAKTVKEGALFSVESISPQTIFYGMVGATRQRKANTNGSYDKSQGLERFRCGLFADKNQAVVQLGGDESTGLGVTQLHWVLEEVVS